MHIHKTCFCVRKKHFEATLSHLCLTLYLPPQGEERSGNLATCSALVRGISKSHKLNTIHCLKIWQVLVQSQKCHLPQAVWSIFTHPIAILCSSFWLTGVRARPRGLLVRFSTGLSWPSNELLVGIVWEKSSDSDKQNGTVLKFWCNHK